jgi:predicted amidohydrolase
VPDSLVLAVAQPPCVPLDVGANAVAHAVLIRAAAARVMVFPELSLTGYELAAPVVEPDDPRLAPLVSVCAMTGTTALVGAPVAGPHIAMLVIDETGVRVAYRKSNPGAGEAGRFLAGPCPAVLVVDGWRLGLAICRDTGIAAHAAQTAALGIDAYVAGLVDHAHEDGIQQERALRIAAEHSVWVGFASFAGATGGGYASTAGRSAIWSPDGRLVDRAGPEPGGFARATLSRSGAAGRHQRGVQV